MLNVIFFSDKGWKVLQDEWQKSWKCSLEIYFFFHFQKKLKKKVIFINKKKNKQTQYSITYNIIDILEIREHICGCKYWLLCKQNKTIGETFKISPKYIVFFTLKSIF